MPFNRDVIGYVREYHFCFVRTQQASIHVGAFSVTAYDSMLVEVPKISDATNGLRLMPHRDSIFLISATVI